MSAHHYQRWTEEQVAALAGLRAQGMRAVVIASQLGRPAEHVRDKLRQPQRSADRGHRRCPTCWRRIAIEGV